MNTENTVVTVAGVTINITAMHHAARHMFSSDGKLVTLAKAFLTPEVMANREAREYVRKDLGRFMVAELHADTDYARTAWYRMVKYAGFGPDGKPLEQKQDAEKTAAALASDTSEAAWVECYRTHNWEGAQAIIRTLKAAKREAKQK